MTSVVLAADLGAGSLRTAAVGRDGSILAQTVSQSVAAGPAADCHEGDAAQWWAALCHGLRHVQGAVPGAMVEAVAVTAMTRSQVFIDADGELLRPAILWADHRAGDVAKDLERQLPRQNPAVALNAFHPLARLAFVLDREPEVGARLAHVIEPKDYLNFRLTGRLATDSVVIGRLAPLMAEGGPAALARLLEYVPATSLQPTDVLGPVTATELPTLRGVPVVVGSMDAWASAVGAGAARSGMAYDVSGTSEAAGLIMAAPKQAAGLVALPWAKGLFQLGGPTQAGADAVRWAFETFRADGTLETAVDRAAANHGAETPQFLPYLSGERAPVWRDDVGGMFFGLDRSHGPDDLLAAAMEGVAQAVRDIIAVAEGDGTRADVVRICGGGARSDPWCQLRADVAGRPFERPRTVETGLIGAAAAAFAGIGAFGNLAEAADTLNPTAARFEPRKALADRFAQRAARYDALKAFVLGAADAPPPGGL
ncbi:MAG: FGGY-family carbohydrate kinase [Pseudomonadota bacterium]